MKEQEIIEGNKLIAEFMEYQILHKRFQYQSWNSSNESYFSTDTGDIVCDKHGHEVNLYPDGDPLMELSELPFNSSWDWLMPVITKCIEKNIWYSDWTNQLHDGLLEQDIEQCWIACVEFIKTLK